MKKIIIIVVVVLVAGAGGAVFWSRCSAERLFSALEADQRPSGARERLQKIVDRHPEDLNAQQWLLRLQIEAGDISAAQNRLNLLQVKAPDYYGTVSNACLLYLHKRQGEKAAKNCLRAVELSGRSVEDLNRLASAYLLLQDFFKALPTLQEALQKSPDNLKVMNNMGYYFLLVGVYEESIRFLKQALERDPNFIESRKNLARAYYEAKQYQESAAEIEKILAREPYNKDMLLIMAIIQTKYFHNRGEGTKYAKRAIDMGMDRQRAEALLQMLAGDQPPPPIPMPGSGATVEPPRPIGPEEARRLHSGATPAPTTKPKPSTPPLPPSSAPAPSPIPGAPVPKAAP